MFKAWLVARNEYRTHVQKRSFLLGLLSVPLIVVVIVGVALLLNPPRDQGLPVIGYVDHSGLLTLPLSTEDATHWGVRLTALESEAARDALEQGQILAYYVVPPGYPTDKRVSLYAERNIPGEAVGAFQTLLRINLLTDQPPEIARRAVAGSHQVIRLTDGRELGSEFNVGYILPVLGSVVLLVLIFFGSSYLMDALTEERINRTMEILATSVSLGQLMAGKIVGTVAVILTQFATWTALIAAALAAGRTLLNLDWQQNMQVQPAALGLVLALILPTFLLIASLVAIVGVLLADPRASGQVMGAFVFLTIFPIGLIPAVLESFDGVLPVIMSMAPFAAAIFLPLRVSMSVVPAGQVAASLGVQYLLALGALWLAGRAVRLGTLRYGQTVRWDELLGRSPKPAVPTTTGVVHHTTLPDRAFANLDTASVRGPRRSRTLSIMRWELVNVITRPWFVLAIVGLPLLIVGQLYLLYRQTGHIDAGTATGTNQSVTQAVTPQAVGYVDQAGLVQSIPAQVPPGALVAYPDESSAQQAMDGGAIASYVVIPSNYVQVGQLTVVRRNLNIHMQREYRWIGWTLLTNLLGGDTRLASQVENPLNIQVEDSTPASAAAEAQERTESEARVTSMMVVLLFYAVIVMGAGFLLRSVSEEKKNRTIELLLLSASPEQILAGKTIALGLVGLLQGVGWVVITYLLFSLAGMNFRLPGGISLRPEFLVGAAVFFLLGYAVYASLYAGAGALVPDWRQAGGVSLLVILPAFVGFEVSLMSENPHSLLMVITSIFPLTAPVVMIKRLLSGGVPLWQLGLSAALMAATAYWVMRVVARMFHARNLLSGQPFSVRRYFRELFGQRVN